MKQANISPAATSTACVNSSNMRKPLAVIGMLVGLGGRHYWRGAGGNSAICGAAGGGIAAGSGEFCQCVPC